MRHAPEGEAARGGALLADERELWAGCGGRI